MLKKTKWLKNSLKHHIRVLKKPTFAEEVDALGRTPLHLASAEGHTEIVRALLQATTQVCFAFNRDERIPLHLATMRGRKEIVQELISAQPESIRVNFNEESVLHLCVRYNQWDALKCLVESAACNELLISKDRHGNSILDLAVMLKQKKTIKYLRSVPGIERESTLRRLWGCVQSTLGKRLKNPRNWIDKTRGSLMTVATVMATMSFQAGISPPGGVWPKDMKRDGYTCLEDST
ncbi:hypothetical protein FH972_027023 [Carpinus fangiana]|uniref:PGG domain-containing protein n=1 Tax=Carpinus fangiana TaxID=176857 RepID=A0A5N6L5Z4_9ROSI|nr:hypothetical protein FH972_027023 [Carpinus fangiana]